MLNQKSTPTIVLKIHGLDCAEEVSVLKREIGPLVDGAERLSFDILNGKMTIEASEITEDALIAAVNNTGMRAERWNNRTKDDESYSRSVGQLRVWLTLLSSAFTLVGLMLHAVKAGNVLFALRGDEFALTPFWSKVSYSLAAIAGVWLVLPKAWAAVRRLRPDMNALMVVAVLGAVSIGEWFEAATVACLFSLSLLLEAWSVSRACRAVASLMELSPTQVRVVNEGQERLATPDQVRVGDRFLVRPGEKIPLDGEILTGSTAVNQAPITGESMPVSKQPGDVIFAGTVNGDGAIEVRSTKLSEDTTLAQIVRLVEAAQSRRAPSEQWVERFARIYTPSVMVVAILVLLIPPLLSGGQWSIWLFRALILLVIACPCALVISTPVSIVAALAVAARNGVLIKGGAFVEAPAQLKAIAFDKTGTLTQGKPSVVKVIPMNGHTVTELLERACGLESLSPHPLAKAVIAYALEQGVTAIAAKNVQVVPGKGVTGTINQKEYWLGSHRFFHDRGQLENSSLHDELEQLATTGLTLMLVGNDNHVCGVLALADTIRPTAKQMVTDLRAAGIEHLVLLTGDNASTAKSVGDELGFDEVRFELLPADKVVAVEDLVTRFKHVAMVGDGVNDTPALGRATVGIAMGAAGTDAAIETADIALMSDELNRLPWLIRHSKRTLTVIRQNILFSLTVKGVFVILTLFGYANMWGAIAADAGASLIVIANGLRLIRTKAQH
jgi:Zn2+/Cd2+-exporting ATPase